MELAITLGVSVLVALGGFAWNLRLARRKDQLDRVNRQLGELYGPLFAAHAASRRIYLAFRDRYRPADESYFSAKNPPTEEEVAAWREWMTHVFMPLNRRMTEAIIANADLLREEHLPGCLQELCAHVAGYEAVLRHWEADDVVSVQEEDNLSVVPYPWRELDDYVPKSFEALAQEQAKLLAQVKSVRDRG
jgi:hypothetical protein